MPRLAKSMLAMLLLNLTGLALVSGQDSEGQDRKVAPIENSEFWGLTSTAKITRRFEIYDPHTLTDLQAVREMGFDQVILDRSPLHAQATELGLKVVLANWWTNETPQDVVEQALRVAEEVAPGQLAGISVMDEPEKNAPDTPFGFYVDLYRKLKPRMTGKLDGVRLEISYWGPLSVWDHRYYEYFSYLYEAADVMRIMPYPDLHEAPLGDVYLMMQRSKRAMQLAEVDLPQIVILQTWVLPPKNKLPTITELRVMAYQAMLGGAEVLSFFEYNPELWAETPGFTDQFRGLMVELRALSDRLQDASLESMLLENGILETTARWSTGGTARIRVNTNRYSEAGLQELEIQDSSLPIEQLALNATERDVFSGEGCLALAAPKESPSISACSGLVGQPSVRPVAMNCPVRSSANDRKRPRWFPALGRR